MTKYKSKENFLTLFAPDRQSKYVTKHLDKCFTGEAPSVKRLEATFGEDTAIVWLNIQLTDLAIYAGIKEKPSIEVLNRLSEVIIANYHYLKVTEFMVFFQRFKAGKYGSFYGTFDALVITKSLDEFLNFRLTKLKYRL